MSKSVMCISDIHGSEQALAGALKIYDQLQCRKLVILGDILYHGPRNSLPEHYNPAQCLTMLNERAEQIIAVQGNCDSEVDQMVLDFPVLARYSSLLLDNRHFFLTHGHHYSMDSLPRLEGGSVFVFGHIHIPLAEKRQDIYLFNPGSISLPKEGNPPSFGIIETGRLSVYDFSMNLLASTELRGGI